MMALLGPDGKPLASQETLTAGYRREPGVIMPLWYNKELPPLNWFTIPEMLLDPVVNLGLKMLWVPIAKATFVIKSRDAELREFVVDNLRRIWMGPISKCDTCLPYGYAAAEVFFEEQRDKTYFSQLKDIHPSDARVVTYKGKLHSVHVKGGGIDVYLPEMRTLWLTSGARFGNWYGTSVLYPALWSWVTKTCKDGALDATRLWYHKYAYRGYTIRYPEEQTLVNPAADTSLSVSAQHHGRAMAEYAKNGAIFVLPSTKDLNGNYLWEAESPTSHPSPIDIREWISDLNRDILRGLGIPDEVLMSDGTGAYAGRRVPERAFNGMCESRLREIATAVIQQLIKPLVRRQFGEHHEPFEVTPKNTEDQQPPEPANPQNQSPQDQLLGRMPMGMMSVPLERDETALIRGEDVYTGRFRHKRRGIATNGVAENGLMLSSGMDKPTRITALRGKVANTFDLILEWAGGAAKKLSGALLSRLKKFFAQEWSPWMLRNRLADVLTPDMLQLQNVVQATIKAGYIAGAGRVAAGLPQDPVAGSSQVHATQPSGPALSPVPTFEEFFGDVPDIKLPALEAAYKMFVARVPMLRHQWEQIDENSRQQAFTVARVQTEETVAKIQDAMATVIRGEQTLRQFRQVLTEDFGTLPIGEGHMETVFRTNLQTALNAGQWETIQNPAVGVAFPYIAYDAIADTRVRETHLEMMYQGLDGTKYYRSDDPIWRMWIPPNGFSCRCSVSWLTREQAAARGVREAVEWIRTGIRPEPGWTSTTLMPDPGFATSPALAGGTGMMSVDANGMQHKDKGQGGGQFTSNGQSSTTKRQTVETTKVKMPSPALSGKGSYVDKPTGSKLVSVAPSGQIKLTKPKNVAEAVEMVKAVSAIHDAAMADVEAVKDLPDNTPAKVHASMRAVHVSQQLLRASAMAKPFAGMMSAAHAPAGYNQKRPLVIDGKKYVGGEFIPGKTQAEVNKAAAKQKGTPAKEAVKTEGKAAAKTTAKPATPKTTAATAKTKQDKAADAQSKTKPAARVTAKPLSDKSAKAKAAYVPTNAEVQRYSEEYNEPIIARRAGGVSFPDSEPIDVAIPIDNTVLKHWQSVVDAHTEAIKTWEQLGKKGKPPSRGDMVGKASHGIEIKTMVSSKHGKLTMNAYAQVRKIVWEREQKAVYHTIVADDRLVYNANGVGEHGNEKDRVYYYRRGVAGSAYVHAMHRCESLEEAIKLMNMPEKQLPPKARRTDQEYRDGQWKFFTDDDGRGYKNLKTGRIVRPKK